MIYSLKQLIER